MVRHIASLACIAIIAIPCVGQAYDVGNCASNDAKCEEFRAGKMNEFTSVEGKQRHEKTSQGAEFVDSSAPNPKRRAAFATWSTVATWSKAVADNAWKAASEAASSVNWSAKMEDTILLANDAFNATSEVLASINWSSTWTGLTEKASSMSKDAMDRAVNWSAPLLQEARQTWADSNWSSLWEGEGATAMEDESNESSTKNSSLVERQVKAILSLQPIPKQFYAGAAKKISKLSGYGCAIGALAGVVLGGPTGALVGIAKGCAGTAFILGLIGALDVPSKQWSQGAQAAFRARKAYSLSFAWLDIAPHEVIAVEPQDVPAMVNKAFRECALRFHPDKLQHLPDIHKKRAMTRFDNCKFAKKYILQFQEKYGALDPEDQGEAAKEFLIKFAGAWAANFGANEHGAGALSPAEVNDWMASVRHHRSL